MNNFLKLSDEEMEFGLTEEEKRVYDQFSNDLEEDYLKELPPISIAKLYVYALKENNREVEYALYTDQPDKVAWTKKEHLQFPNEEFPQHQFEGIESGIFTLTSEDDGVISYFAKNKQHVYPMSFGMVKDEDGIWNVRFIPIQ
ncbi:RNA polymerase subunit sigma [Bacillus carboniphilus]|uniref:RNA polymerase subunit sigma n=1 Tax=Bacillus carboniphilus TaxID=86663 RepID=A0ABY9JPQ4_9BACI|nr:RNA polymerase subunit sigma [Bacillus carboniphilus]WLR41391.1 RNA polymerase subunit sigma [Bacillus carboniphilus]